MRKESLASVPSVNVNEMRQAVDVLAVFDIGAMSPRPIRFKVLEHGIKTTVKVTGINRIEWMGAGGTTRIEYDCVTVSDGRRVTYKLLYYYHECKWELSTA